MLSALLVSAALVFTEADAGFALDCASNFVVKCTPRDAGTVGGHLAANWILDAASIAGADVRRDRFSASVRSTDGKLVERNFVNLYATFRTLPTAPWLVFLSHYDTKPGSNCPGANDGASTTGLLISLASALSSRGHDGKANVMLVWLDGEENIRSYGENDGFWGSKRAAAEIRRRGLDVRAVVCLDMLGDRNLAITIPSNGTANLIKIVQIAAKRAGVSVSCIAESVKDDHVAFLDAGYSAVDVIDFDYGSKPGRNDWWHTPQDTPDKLDRASFLTSGRLVAELVNILAK